MMNLKMKPIIASLLMAASLLSTNVHAERIKDIADIQGVRSNQLVGYGLVVGLDGTGDQTVQTPFTVQSLISMLQSQGVNLPVGTNLQLKNVAAVLVTSTLAPYSQPGQTMDVTVSSMGNAKSLRGGTLLMTPLKGADGKVYAMAQGNLVVGGVGASANGTSTQVNHLSVGRISSGATVEKTVASTQPITDVVTLELKESDFSTAENVVGAINSKFGPGTAEALDARVIRVKQSASYNKVSFMAALESIQVKPVVGYAKIILNARTGSVVINQAVTVENCAISHGNLTVTINTQPVVSQPGALSGGQTVTTQNSVVEINKEPGKVVQLPRAATLSDVVKSLNAIGATPQDLLAILQAMKSSGALHAEIEVI